MDLMGKLTVGNGIRGITLNSQEIDLFDIIEQAQSQEEAVGKTNRYLRDMLEGKIIHDQMEAQRLGTIEKVKRVIREKIDFLPDKEAFFNFLMKENDPMQIRAHLASREELERFFSGKKIDPLFIDAILEIKKYIVYQSNGILTFLVDSEGNTIDAKNPKVKIDEEKTYQKIRALYYYIIGQFENGGKRFTRLTLDGQAKFGTVAGIIKTEREAEAKTQDYNLTPLKQGYEFARRHGMNEVYINALVFFKDFQDRLVGGTKEQYKTALINYGKAIATVVNEYEQQGIHTVVDMFNEFVDYNAPFLERTNNWMSKLSVEDLCDIAATLKAEMPNADFGYNDWNLENPEKRQRIFDVIRKIQAYEQQHGCKILDHIGTQCHTSINDIEGLIRSIEELQQFGLPIDITELDISKGLDGTDIYKKKEDGEYERDDKGKRIIDYTKVNPDELAAIMKYERKLQNDALKVLSEFAQQGKIRCITSWSITDELCCDFCNEKEASVTGMAYDSQNGFVFFGKDMDEVIEMIEEEMRLIDQHRGRIKRIRESEINQNPTQDFCCHTHTERCGHGAKDTGDEEWVQCAIQGGIKTLVFTDHVPVPDEFNDQHKAKSRMDIAEVDSYLASIRYLQEKYRGQIEIKSGFEFEYSNRDLEHLQTLKSKTDKMILGQHFVIDSRGNEYKIDRVQSIKQVDYRIFDDSEKKELEGKSDDDIVNLYKSKLLDLYANSILCAMDTEPLLPDIIAHPDLFMLIGNDFGDTEEQIARAICRKASEKRIPLEINFGKIASKIYSGMSIQDIKQRTPYPSPEFWKIVAEETEIARRNGQDLLVVYGKDAHYPGQLATEKDYEIAKAIIGEETLEQLHIVTSYNELEHGTNLTLTQIGKVTTGYFSSNPEVAKGTWDAVERAIQQFGKDPITQGEG